MINTVFFDLDDTLFDFKRSERVALSKTLDGLGIKPTEEILNLYHAINKAQWKALERGEATREFILLQRYVILFNELGYDIPAINAQKAYEKNLSESYFYIDGALEVLEETYQKYDLCLASNGTAKVQDGRIGLSGIGKYFKHIFISERVGHNKPSESFFSACFNVIGQDRRKSSIIIGDSLSSDILGGYNAGIKTVLYNPSGAAVSGAVKPDYTVRDILEIPALLEKINEG